MDTPHVKAICEIALMIAERIGAEELRAYMHGFDAPPGLSDDATMGIIWGVVSATQLLTAEKRPQQRPPEPLEQYVN